MDNRPIGVFDSGYGGLSVLKELRKIIPNENYIYFGDNKRTPYGSKDRDTIQRYSKEVVKFLVENNAKIVILACNTVTANALEYLESIFNIPIVGIIRTGAVVAAKESTNKNIAVLATEATINSNVYEETLKQINHNIDTISMACPKLVPLIEKGDPRDREIYSAAREYYSKIQNEEFDTLILGCTHYPHIIDIIKEIFGEDINYINPAVKLSEEVKKYLESNDLSNNSIAKGKIEFYTSGRIDDFKENGSFYFNESIEIVKNKMFE